nr:uncharacterized protein LOC109776999 [Aegilops tauschii subsp. strangulata]
MPTFDGRGLVSPGSRWRWCRWTCLLAIPAGRGEEEEGEERDSEATPEGMGETSRLHKADILRTLPDDNDEAEVPPEREEPPVAGDSSGPNASPRRRSPAEVPTRGRSALISRDVIPTPTPLGATSGPSAVPSSAPGARAPAPQAARLSGFKLKKRRDYDAVDQPTPAAKKRKEEEVVLLGTRSPTAAAPLSMDKGSDSSRASPARSSSQGSGKHPREKSAPVAPLALEVPTSGPGAGVPEAQELLASQAMETTSPPPPPPAALLSLGPSASPDILERALSAMTLLREDLRGADPRLVAGHLELVSGWLHSNVSVWAALSQAAATSEKDKQATTQAAAACEVALKDVGVTHDRCQLLEAELKTLRNERVKEAHGRKAEEDKMKAREDAVRGRDTELEQLGKAQAAERSRLEKLKREMEAEKAELDAKAKEEARILSSAALTRVFIHLHLRDPTTHLDELLEPVDAEHYAAAAEAVKSQVEALLKRFRAFDPVPSTGGAADPATPAGGAGEGNAATGEASLVGDGGARK